MFGLTHREQRWKAEQRAAETLADLAKSVVASKAQAYAAKFKADEAESLRLHSQEIAMLRAENEALTAANQDLKGRFDTLMADYAALKSQGYPHLSSDGKEAA
ncbi:MAG: hypothetical protein ACRCV9_21070 [Burkholderiaceae bacterium]